MSRKDHLSAQCVVRNEPHESAGPKAGPEDCRIVDSAQRLMALGLAAVEIEGVGIPEAALQAMCEYARLDGNNSSQQPTELVGTALETLSHETRKVDMELEMLRLRKRALTKRSRLLHKLAGMLQDRDV